MRCRRFQQGFKVEAFATGLKAPRQIRRAPNGDLFVMEQALAGQITILRGNKDGKPEERLPVYATGLTTNFGINFYPPGPNPQWIYVGNTGSVVRFAYKNGDLKASGPPEVLISDIPPRGNHSTRDIVFSKDGTKMFVAVGVGRITCPTRRPDAGNIAPTSPAVHAGRQVS